MIEYLSKQIKTYEVSKEQIIKQNSMYKVLVNRDDQFVKKLDENNAKLKFIPKEIEKLKNQISILHNHVDFYMKQAILEPSKMMFPFCIKKS